MLSVESVVLPMHSAVSLPSAIIATTVSFSTGCGIKAPGDVNPGHMMLAPLSTNRIAPLSTWSIGRKKGNLCRSRNVGIHGPSRCLKNKSSPLPLTSSSIWSWLRGEKFYNYFYLSLITYFCLFTIWLFWTHPFFVWSGRCGFLCEGTAQEVCFLYPFAPMTWAVGSRIHFPFRQTYNEKRHLVKV